MRQFFALILSTVGCLPLCLAGPAPFPLPLHVEGGIECQPSTATPDTLGQLAMHRPLEPCMAIGLGAEGLRLARNTLFARHGYSFESRDLHDYFRAQSWYMPDPSFDPLHMSDVEKSNVQLLSRLEKLAAKPGVMPQDIHQLKSENALHGFPEPTSFLLPVTSLSRNHSKVHSEQSKLKFASGKTVGLQGDPPGKEYAFEDLIVEKPDWRVIKDGILVFRPYSHSGMEGVECRAELYTFEGILKQSLPWCPGFMSKFSESLFVQFSDEGCCGETNIEVRLWNAATGKELDPRGEWEVYATALITAQDSEKEIVIAASPGYEELVNTFIVVGRQGDELVRVDVIYLSSERYGFRGDSWKVPFHVTNFAGIAKLPGDYSWMLKFKRGLENARYLLIQEGPDRRASQGALRVATKTSSGQRVESEVWVDGSYRGRTPYAEFIALGTHQLKIKGPKEDRNIDVKVLKGKIVDIEERF